MDIKLKPCPFCGGEAKVGDYMLYASSGKHIKCTRCSARSGFYLIDSPKVDFTKKLDESTRYTEEQAIEKAAEDWNRRAASNGVALYIKDLTDGTVRKYGTDCHDALLICDGVLQYENFQNGDGSPTGYCFCHEDGETNWIPEGAVDEERYVHIGIIE